MQGEGEAGEIYDGHKTLRHVSMISQGYVKNLRTVFYLTDMVNSPQIETLDIKMHNKCDWISGIYIYIYNLSANSLCQ